MLNQKIKVYLILSCAMLFLILSCNVQRPSLQAELIAIVDNYPQNYEKYKNSIDYSRNITLCFKIINTKKKDVFIPLDNMLDNKFYSIIEVSTIEGLTVAPSNPLVRSNFELLAGDSTIIYVHLMSKELQELDLATPYMNPAKIIKKITCGYKIDKRDMGASTAQIPELEFCHSSKIKYIYRSPMEINTYQ